MAFRQYAIQYILADDETQLSDIARRAAADIRDSRGATSVVAQWADSVKEWITPPSDDDQMDDGEGEGAGDIIARAKALDFLAATLEALEPSVLRAEQVKMLVQFFGSLCGIDHKAGIMAAAKALRRLTRMSSFHPQQGDGILASLSKLGDDFRLQTPATRLVVYELIRALATNQQVASELQFKHGAASGFMNDLLHLCRNERDPTCLMAWFPILRIFLTEYDPSEDMVGEIFKAFSAYFPISLRTSATPSGITSSDLKTALRSCFAAHDKVAKHAFPFLLQKLDQGEALTVAVRVDILTTIKTCVDEYSHPTRSTSPFADKLWNSLKYEVRNGEVEDTIDWTLRVMTSLGGKLKGDDLRRFVVTVLRDCIEDIGNPTYAAQSGKLLRSVFSGSAAAYVLVAPSILPHLKSNFGRPKSSKHTRDLLNILNALLEERSRLVEKTTDWTPDDTEAMKLVSDSLRGLFAEVYEPAWSKATSSTNPEDASEYAIAALHGMALLSAQRRTEPSLSDSGGGASGDLLCDSGTCKAISELLDPPVFVWDFEKRTEGPRLPPSVVDEAVLAYRQVFQNVLPEVTSDLLTRSYYRMHACVHPDEEVGGGMDLQKRLHKAKVITLRLAFVTATGIPKAPALPLTLFSTFLHHSFIRLEQDLSYALDSGLGCECASLEVAAIHSAMLGLTDALADQENSASKTTVPAETTSSDSSGPKTLFGYNLPLLDSNKDDPSATLRLWAPPALKEAGGATTAEKFKVLCLHAVSQLYRQAVRVIADTASGEPRCVGLASLGKAEASRSEARGVYLYHVGRLATWAVRQLTPDAQRSLKLSEEAVLLFKGDDPVGPRGATLRQAFFSDPTAISGREVALSTEDGGGTLVLSQGVLEGLHPAAMEDLYRSGMATAIILQPFVEHFEYVTPTTLPIVETILAVLANKNTTAAKDAKLKIDWIGDMARIERTVRKLFALSSNPEPHELMNLSGAAALAAGLAARCDPAAKLLLRGFTSLLGHEFVGPHAARAFGQVVMPRACLAAENHAVLKPLRRQWVYMDAVAPLWEMALPAARSRLDHSGDQAEPWAVRGTGSENYKSAILGIVAHVPFAAWEHDAQKLARLLLATLGSGSRSDDAGAEKKGGGQAEEDGDGGLDATLKMVLQLLANSAEVLEEHLGTLVNSCVTVYRGAAGGGRGALRRKLALQILAQLPGSFEERRLLAHGRPMARFLAGACGDPVREVRGVAVEARSRWARVG